MSDDVRRETETTDGLDRRDRHDDAARADDRGTDVEYTENRTDEGLGDRDDTREGVDGGDRLGDESGRRDTNGARTGDAAEHRDAGEGRDISERETHRDPSSERQPTAGPGSSDDDGLLNSKDRGSYQQRWDDIQVRFIDEPRQCVREADDLVGEVTTRISDRFTNERQDMEQRWDGGNEPTTEELRQAVQRYRDFFQRLVAN